jgi:hypothetical protein
MSPNPPTGSPSAALDRLADGLAALRPKVDAHVTPERVIRYLTVIAETPAPSTTASDMRAPVLRELLRGDGALEGGGLAFDANFQNTASTVLLSGSASPEKALWYFAHLDTISYLVQPFDGRRFPLVPFCYHLIEGGSREARAYRFDLFRGEYGVIAEGRIGSDEGTPFFAAEDPGLRLQPGDRVVPVARCAPSPDGHWTGQFDNAGGVAALAVAAPLLAEAGVDALLAFPDEEEGPPGVGSQVMGRGGSRIISRLPAPDLAIIADMQQAGGLAGREDGVSGTGNGIAIGRGAVLSEFSSRARGAVTPPPLYALARHLGELLAGVGVRLQESRNAYTSRSDDVSVLLKTPNILLLGFPGRDRHFDRGEPRADPSDIADLAKTLVYASLLQAVLRSSIAGGER